MIIVIHCGGMPFNGETIKGQSLGGSESAAYYMAKALAKLGHRVTVFTNHPDEGVWDDVKYINAGPVSNEHPLGARFHFYAHNTPHDVCIVQRALHAFTFKWASKLNMLWMHDLGLTRFRDVISSGMWNVDAVLSVSEWHKKQLLSSMDILSPSVIRPITNGVDPDLFRDKGKNRGFKGAPKMLYASRPERGLMNLVGDDGIMVRLLDENPDARLYVCNYDNETTEMRGLYRYLYDRIEQLPNCKMLGHLSKRELAQVMQQMDALCYPTEFEETSCITAMESMAAGLPFISSDCGALSETCAGSGSYLVPLKDGKCDKEAFVDIFAKWTADEKIKSLQKIAAQNFTWDRAAERLEEVISSCFEQRTENAYTLAKHFMHNSDIYALKELVDGSPALVGTDVHRELEECYQFAFSRNWSEHYAKYYEYEKARGVVYGPENLAGNDRFEFVASIVSRLPDGCRVLDYGCAHGHYTVNLAKRFPKLSFTGVDITRSNIEAARKWADDEGLTNTEFFVGQTGSDGIVLASSEEEIPLDHFHIVIAAEVLEHVESPHQMVDTLSKYLSKHGKMLLTTPFGAWEAVGYKEHWPWRAHVHHLERADLHDMFSHHGKFSINVVPSGVDKFGDIMGSYVTVFNKPVESSRGIDYGRKMRVVNPRQTLSVCMIVKDGGLTLARCLESVKNVADEIIIGIDETTTDDSELIAMRYGATVFKMESPLKIGFDEARNQSIARAGCEWILWIDADEVLHHQENLAKYLRVNQNNGYAVKQHHFSVEPPGIIRTDLPCRVFRNKIGVKFFGVVHEHPELALNEGIGHAMLISDLAIAHHGYSTEDVRRGRFHRNIGLMVRDREKYPARVLGKYLWIRDVAQMCSYEMEQNGGVITTEMKQRAQAGIDLWVELLESNNVRLLTDGLEYYSALCKVAGGGFEYAVNLGTSKLNGGVNLGHYQPLHGHFLNVDHAERFTKALLKERTKSYESRYF